ncbi:MAG: epoxyqueuosine reductase QueH [Desulfitobacteriia bacterium]|jgi:predicted adenine nucleotide alpha hydrolase (AANH) superfamily ATPase
MPKEEVLVHACCATCAGYVLHKTAEEGYIPVIYFYNPNIYPQTEYKIRKDELRNYAAKLKIRFIEEEYKPSEWSEYIRGLENEPERGLRCHKCFDLRLSKAADFALNNNIRIFTTTLTVSPHKNSKVILNTGAEIAKKRNLLFWAEDFKKKDGFRKTMEIAKKEGFYRQNYCGCFYSQR